MNQQRDVIGHLQDEKRPVRITGGFDARTNNQTVLRSEASARGPLASFNARRRITTQKKKMRRTCLGRSCGDPIGCLPSGQSDPGLVLAQSDGIGSAGEAFIALAKHRHVDRDKDPPLV